MLPQSVQELEIVVNAALAAERENSEKAAARAELAQINLNIANEAMIKAIRIADDYEKQLAAERERFKIQQKNYIDLCDSILGTGTRVNECRTCRAQWRAKVKVGK